MTRPAVYLLVTVLLSAITTAVIALNVAAMQREESIRRDRLAQQESDHRWCALLGALDGVKLDDERVAEEIHRLRVSFGCQER